MTNWFIYILFCDQKTFYVGMTDNIERRFLEHKNGYSNFTKKFSDIQLVYTENFTTRNKAESRERQIKGWSIAKKKALIIGDKNLLKKLSKSTGIGEV
ncbi:MAG: GIY-YIG nuclease family protein [Patescibacteria group bacterium]